MNSTINALMSQMSAGTGIPLSKLRASGASIRPTAVSSMVNCDASSMYPNVMSAWNGSQRSGKLTSDDFNYLVRKEAPYDVKRLPKEYRISINTDIGEQIVIMAKYDIFTRRYEAEEQSLKHHRDNGPIETALSIHKQLETLEEDHPEWLI